MNISETNSSSLAALNAQITSIYTASCTINIFLGLPTNVYVLWLILTGAGGTMASDFFSLNLAVSEVLYCLFSVFVLVNNHIPTTALAYLADFSFGFLSAGRPLFQCCICVERYLAVVHPVVFLKYKPLRYRVGWAAGAWGVTLMFTGTAVSLYAPQFPIHCFITYILLFLFVDLFCSLSILRGLKHPKLGQGEMEKRGGGEKEKEGMNAMKKRAFMIVSVVMTTMLINNILTAVIYLLCDFIAPKVFCLLDAFNMLLLVLCGLVQPLFYLHRSRKLPCCLRGQ